jgi:hypothetical protein
MTSQEIMAACLVNYYRLICIDRLRYCIWPLHLVYISYEIVISSQDRSNLLAGTSGARKERFGRTVGLSFV